MATLRNSYLLGLLVGAALASGAVAAATGVDADTTVTGSAGGIDAVVTTTLDDTSTTPDVAGVGSTATTGPFDVTLLTVEDPIAGDEMFPPEAGDRYLGVELQLRNTSAETQTFSSLISTEVIDSDGQTWASSFFAVSDRSSLDGDVPAGESQRGWVGFELPETSTGLRLFVEGDVFGDSEPAAFALDAAAATADPPPDTKPTATPGGGDSGDGGDGGVGSMAATGPFEVTLLTVEDPLAPNEVFPPEEGSRYIGVELAIRNTSADTQPFSSLLFTEVVDGEGQTWAASLFAVTNRSSLDGDIPPGESRRGWIGFELPVESTGLRLFIAGDVFGGGEAATFDLDAVGADSTEPPASPPTTDA